MLCIILILLVIYLILVNKKEHFYSNIIVHNSFVDIVSAIDDASAKFLNIISTNNTKGQKINILRAEIIKQFGQSKVGRVKQFCSFTEGLYPYFYLFLFYTRYKNHTDTKDYIDRTIKKSNNIQRIFYNRLAKTQQIYNKSSAIKNNNYRFIPYYGNKIATEYIMNTEKDKFLNILHKTFQNNGVNPKAIIIFNSPTPRAEKDDTVKGVFKYIITQKIAIKSIKSAKYVTWARTNCKDIMKYPEDVFTYELNIELIKVGKKMYCNKLSVVNLCMLSLRPCFKENMDKYMSAELLLLNEDDKDKKKDSVFISKDDMQKDFSRKLRNHLEIYGENAGNCFDSNNNILLNKKRRSDCPTDKYTWSIPCTRDRDCPYYKKNNNYTNEHGKCVNNYCDIPLGVKSKGYNTKQPMSIPGMRRTDNIDNAFCYNCPTSNPRCCKSQKDPDYAFKNDYEERLKHRNELAAKGLQVKKEHVDLKNILAFTSFK